MRRSQIGFCCDDNSVGVRHRLFELQELLGGDRKSGRAIDPRSSQTGASTDIVEGKITPSFELLKPYIKSCHINDLTNDKAGKYPYRELFQKFTEMGYDRYTLCEVGKSYDPKEGEEFMKGYKKLWDELAGA